MAQNATDSEEIHSLTIDEETVSALEQIRDRLQEFAYTVRTPEGWRFEVLQEHSLFTQAGLRSGDFISEGDIEMELQRPEQTRLVARMIAILNSIQR